MLVQPDKNWTIYDDFKPDHTDWVRKNSPYLHLKKEVHTAVVESFDIVGKLIEHSYFECRFYEVATLKAVLTFEMALKLRFRELNPGATLPKSLQLLIKWFETRYYFEVYNDFYLNAIRSVRNHHAHAETQGYSGAMSKNFIGNIVDLVNELYEDPVLTSYRINAMVAAGKLLENISNGMVLVMNGKRHLCYRAWIGFIDNKCIPHKINLYYCLCDSISEAYYKKNNWAITTAEYVVAQSVEVLQDRIKLHTTDTEEIIVEQINLQVEQQAYDKWMLAYPHLQNYGGTIYFKGRELVDAFEQHLRAFHHA